MKIDFTSDLHFDFVYGIGYSHVQKEFEINRQKYRQNIP